MLTTYTVLLTFHILAAATWVGGGVMLLILSGRARGHREDPSRLANLVRDIASSRRAASYPPRWCWSARASG